MRDNQYQQVNSIGSNPKPVDWKGHAMAQDRAILYTGSSSEFVERKGRAMVQDRLRVYTGSSSTTGERKGHAMVEARTLLYLANSMTVTRITRKEGSVGTMCDFPLNLVSVAWIEKTAVPDYS